ncbi:Ribosomal RNA small subunit methyltransferase G [Planktothrix tepida]|uniref:Ribosomal RNA small subunit methyltransferase G n=2 Tax=Planktothrix TaxID=54304 RepID=A0A1J1LQ88_9CYAN|nr:MULTISPECIES: 16S rRNA (guanine(527)-N(7))-methyltransferase RsmG [Planktothrix]CAD5949299.1 Ribosomal RNA small subunit methyltransferase G [Planktothrix pseudagardhii]CAD5961086.1 Ribosomal RNA small subunit methyltransferase G [Planktothrix tepida]CUR34744.1 Ribosomal RNA small subunit methyltransferase G [Planktothrix tepida PCC 9214]
MNQTSFPKLPELTAIWQDTLNWQPTPAQQDLFQQLFELILEFNQQLNLTRLTEPEEFWEKHLWDSLRGIAPVLSGKIPAHPGDKIIDIGTGGGFPGIPVALVLPDCSVTLLDSTRKKITALTTILEQLNIKNTIPWVGRAEALGQHPKHRESYQLALLRAVAPPSVSAEYALPLLKIGGLGILYRGHWTTEEEKQLTFTVKQLGGIIESVDEFTTPLTNSVRHCVSIKKVKYTPKQYPRNVGVPGQKPL